MTERIDFALEPGVVIFAILFFVLVNVLLGAVLYPYFRDSGGEDTAAEGESAAEPEPMTEEADDQEPLEERVDEFLEDMHSERAG
jgi:hypothetical protein